MKLGLDTPWDSSKHRVGNVVLLHLYFSIFSVSLGVYFYPFHTISRLMRLLSFFKKKKSKAQGKQPSSPEKLAKRHTLQVWRLVFLNTCTVLRNFLFQKKKTKQEAFRERRHLHVCDLWPWRVTLTSLKVQESLCHQMLIVLYLGSRYDVWECNSLWTMTINSFLWPLTFTCDLQLMSRSFSL